MDKKIYEMPEMKIIVLDREDIILASGCPTDYEPEPETPIVTTHN